MSNKIYGMFTEAVSERMEALGMSRADLARALGVTPSYVSQILNGHRRPGLDSLEDFAAVLGCQPSDLLRTKEVAKSA